MTPLEQSSVGTFSHVISVIQDLLSEIPFDTSLKLHDSNEKRKVFDLDIIIGASVVHYLVVYSINISSGEEDFSQNNQLLSLINFKLRSDFERLIPAGISTGFLRC